VNHIDSNPAPQSSASAVIHMQEDSHFITEEGVMNHHVLQSPSSLTLKVLRRSVTNPHPFHDCFSWPSPTPWEGRYPRAHWLVIFPQFQVPIIVQSHLKIEPGDNDTPRHGDKCNGFPLRCWPAMQESLSHQIAPPDIRLEEP
jgi:hypothetical protein